jgi:hypothetical protein
MASETNVLAVPKSQEKVFERGFKTWCENTAITVRKRMGLNPPSSLSPYDLAAQIGVTVWTPEEVPNLDAQTRDYLCSHAGDEWSAVTVQFQGKQIIIVNSRHSNARRTSDIMHELAHIVRGHKPVQVFIQDGFALRDFDELQEHEANWLAGCLLLPRTALLNAGYRNEVLEDSIKRFGVSKSLYIYRMNVSGVRRQLSRATA